MAESWGWGWGRPPKAKEGDVIPKAAPEKSLAQQALEKVCPTCGAQMAGSINKNDQALQKGVSEK